MKRVLVNVSYQSDGYKIHHHRHNPPVYTQIQHQVIKVMPSECPDEQITHFLYELEKPVTLKIQVKQIALNIAANCSRKSSHFDWSNFRILSTAWKSNSMQSSLAAQLGGVQRASVRQCCDSPARLLDLLHSVSADHFLLLSPSCVVSFCLSVENLTLSRQ